MKKLLVLVILGFFVFIGGQWWGLRLQESRRERVDAMPPGAEEPKSEASLVPSPAPGKAQKIPMHSAPVEKARPNGSVGP